MPQDHVDFGSPANIMLSMYPKPPPGKECPLQINWVEDPELFLRVRDFLLARQMMMSPPISRVCPGSELVKPPPPDNSLPRYGDAEVMAKIEAESPPADTPLSYYEDKMLEAIHLHNINQGIALLMASLSMHKEHRLVSMFQSLVLKDPTHADIAQPTRPDQSNSPVQPDNLVELPPQGPLSLPPGSATESPQA